MKVSIVICTYNPKQEIIGGLYQSISELKWPDGIDKEVILIDNASDCQLSEDQYIIEWQRNTPINIRVIREEKPGLSNARVRGFKEAEGDLIVCFDDDNKPDESYIETLLSIEKEFPFIGVWGPGNVEVQWLPGADSTIKKEFSDVFQEHHQEVVTYALDFISPNTMPYGTGMILRKEVAELYINWLLEKERRTTGRIGNSLTSYEDVQICWLGMKAGWAVGRHPELIIKHVISPEKAQWDYLARLRFAINSSYAPAVREVLPNKYKLETPNSTRLMGFLFYQYISWLTKKNTPPLNVYMAKPIGQPVGAWKAAEVDPPGWVKRVIKWLYNEE